MADGPTVIGTVVARVALVVVVVAVVSVPAARLYMAGSIALAVVY